MMKRFFLISGLIYFWCAVTGLYAQTGNLTVPAVNGRYQLIDLSEDTPCNCNEKTERYYEVYKGIQLDDFRKYRTIAYEFGLGSASASNSKLSRALETDPHVFKISVREWDYLMLFVDDAFDQASFEKAAMSIFTKLIPITTEDYLLRKNAQLLNDYRTLSIAPQ